MGEAVDLSVFVTPARDGMSQMSLAVEGVHCGGCINRIESALKKMPGVQRARLNFTNHRLTVGWREGELEPADILRKIEQLGYRAYPFSQMTEDEEARHAQWLLRCLGVAGFAAMNIMLLSVSVWSGNWSDITPETRDFFHWISALIALPTAGYAGQPFFRSALRALRNRSLNMDVPISLGVLLALGMSIIETMRHAEHAYFDSAIMLLFFLLAGRYLDHAMRRKTRMAAGNLSALKAEVAHRIVNGGIITVPASTLDVGDKLFIKPGERIPADGVVLSGNSEIDESLVTGETARRRVQLGESVYSGSLNFDGGLTISITAAAESSLLSEIERLLANASENKSRYVRLADRAASLYAPVVHITAALTAIGWLLAGAGLHDSIMTAVTVLIITCPCALALAVPAVQVVATGALFRSGVLVHTGDALERLAEADTIVFDKTGTLTLPEPRVINAHEIPPAMKELAARLALTSHHPLAMALGRDAIVRTPYENAIEVAGRGVSAIIDGAEARLGSAEYCNVKLPEAAITYMGASFIAFRHGQQHAVFAVAQTLRPDALEVTKVLAKRGLDIHIFSGDRPNVVADAAETLGIANWRGALKPADKISAIEGLRKRGCKILMVGDGLNDAPALAAASVSMSPITATQLTQAHADAVFLGERLQPVVDAIEVARKARTLMRQNLWLAGIYNALAVPLAIAGLVTPLVAALAMSASSILVTVNALRAHGTSYRTNFEKSRAFTLSLCTPQAAHR